MNFLETEDVVKQYANHLALNKVSRHYYLLTV